MCWRKIALISSLLSLGFPCASSECDSVPHTFSYTNVTQCNRTSCYDRLVDGCLEVRGFENVFVNSPVKTIKKGAFKKLVDVDVITLGSINISEIEQGAFLNVKSLNYVYLDNNSLEVIHASVFSKLPILWLDISYNYITQIEENAFADMENLIHLDLKFNSLDRVESKWFPRTNNIERILLSYNKLTTLDIGVFSQFVNLRYLQLDHNHIHTVNGKLSPDVKAYVQLMRNNLTDVSFLIGTIIETLDVRFNKISVGDDLAQAVARSMIRNMTMLPNLWLCPCLQRIEHLMRTYQVKDVKYERRVDLPVCVEFKIKRNFCDGVSTEEVADAHIEYFKYYHY